MCSCFRRSTASATTQILLARSARLADSPDRVADIVGDQQAAAALDHPDRAAIGFVFVLAEEPGQHVDWLGALYGEPAIVERDEDHLVTGLRLAVPRAVLADERPARQASTQVRRIGDGCVLWCH